MGNGTRSSRTGTTPRELYSPEEHVSLLHAAYWRQLASHEPLLADLAALIERAGPIATPARAADLTVAPAATALIDDFVTRWRLPEIDRDELPWMLMLARGDPSRAPGLVRMLSVDLWRDERLPRLRRYARSEIDEIELGVEIELLHATERVAFTYRPNDTSPADARRAVDEFFNGLRKTAEEQLVAAEARFQSLGYQPLPPQRLSRATLDASAQRTFRRVVLRWSWTRIATADAVEPRSVIDSVTRFAAALGLNPDP